MIIPNELIFAVDQEDTPVAPISRSEAHHQGVWHRISHVWIINSKKQLLCQKRSLAKDTNPGKWEPFFGGHVGANETYEENAIKETAEETGLVFTPQELHIFTKAQNTESKHFQTAYYVVWNGTLGQVHIEKEEVEKVEWKAISEVEEVLLVKKDPNWVHVVYEQEMIEHLKNLLF